MDLDKLPDLALGKVVEFLDFRSRRACRLVTRKVKEHVDVTGLSIKIDSRQLESANLTNNNNVVATEVRILHLGTFELDEDAIRNWKAAIISAPVKFEYLNNRMFQFCWNLRVLVLNEAALTGEEFKYESEPTPCFSRLIQVHIILREPGYKAGLQELNPEWQDELKSTVMIARIQQNLSLLCKVIRSLVLKVLYISVYGLENTTEQKLCWEYQPLFELLEYHRNSLDTVIIPIIGFGEPPGEYNAIVEVPNQLKRIRVAPFAQGQRQTLPKYWTELLRNQNSLATLSVQAQHRTDEVPFPWLASVVLNCARTLTDVHLGLNFPSGMHTSGLHGTLDMRLFVTTQSLKSLVVWGGKKLKIHNLADLPVESLIKLRLYSTRIAKDFDGMRFMKCFKGRDLLLDRLSKFGNFKHPGYIFQFVKLVLRCRTLEKFELNFFELKSAYPMTSVNELYFEPWIATLEAKNALPNLIYFRSDYSPISSSENTTNNAAESGSSEKWILDTYNPDLNYLEMMEYQGDYRELQREPPFYLPRNLDSFSVWRNEKAQTYRILWNSEPRKPAHKELKHLVFNMLTMGWPQRNGIVQIKEMIPEEDVIWTCDFLMVMAILNMNGAGFFFKSKSSIVAEKLKG